LRQADTRHDVQDVLDPYGRAVLCSHFADDLKIGVFTVMSYIEAQSGVPLSMLTLCRTHMVTMSMHGALPSSSSSKKVAMPCAPISRRRKSPDSSEQIALSSIIRKFDMHFFLVDVRASW